MPRHASKTSSSELHLSQSQTLFEDAQASLTITQYLPLLLLVAATKAAAAYDNKSEINNTFIG
jgi:hypothetical protein